LREIPRALRETSDVLRESLGLLREISEGARFPQVLARKAPFTARN
jgi:hypothetical protein